MDGMDNMDVMDGVDRMGVVWIGHGRRRGKRDIPLDPPSKGDLLEIPLPRGTCWRSPFQGGLAGDPP